MSRLPCYTFSTPVITCNCGKSSNAAVSVCIPRKTTFLQQQQKQTQKTNNNNLSLCEQITSTSKKHALKQAQDVALHFHDRRLHRKFPDVNIRHRMFLEQQKGSISHEEDGSAAAICRVLPSSSSTPQQQKNNTSEATVGEKTVKQKNVINNDNVGGVNGCGVDLVLPSRLRLSRRRWGTEKFASRWLGLHNVDVVRRALLASSNSSSLSFSSSQSTRKNPLSILLPHSSILDLAIAINWGWRESIIKALSPFDILEEKFSSDSNTDSNEMTKKFRQTAKTFPLQQIRIREFQLGFPGGNDNHNNSNSSRKLATTTTNELYPLDSLFHFPGMSNKNNNSNKMNNSDNFSFSQQQQKQKQLQPLMWLSCSSLEVPTLEAKKDLSVVDPGLLRGDGDNVTRVFRLGSCILSTTPQQQQQQQRQQKQYFSSSSSFPTKNCSTHSSAFSSFASSSFVVLCWALTTF